MGVQVAGPLELRELDNLLELLAPRDLGPLAHAITRPGRTRGERLHPRLRRLPAAQIPAGRAGKARPVSASRSAPGTRQRRPHTPENRSRPPAAPAPVATGPPASPARTPRAPAWSSRPPAAASQRSDVPVRSPGPAAHP